MFFAQWVAVAFVVTFQVWNRLNFSGFVLVGLSHFTFVGLATLSLFCFTWRIPLVWHWMWFSDWYICCIRLITLSCSSAGILWFSIGFLGSLVLFTFRGFLASGFFAWSWAFGYHLPKRKFEVPPIGNTGGWMRTPFSGGHSIGPLDPINLKFGIYLIYKHKQLNCNFGAFCSKTIPSSPNGPSDCALSSCVCLLPLKICIKIWVTDFSGESILRKKIWSGNTARIVELLFCFFACSFFQKLFCF